MTQYDGHIFKTVGDGFPAVFNNSLDAVRCALAFQEEIGKQNAILIEGQRLQYRIGQPLPKRPPRVVIIFCGWPVEGAPGVAPAGLVCATTDCWYAPNAPNAPSFIEMT